MALTSGPVVVKKADTTPAARPLLERLGVLGADLMDIALASLDDAATASLLADLSTIKENLRQAVQRRQMSAEEQSYV